MRGARVPERRSAALPPAPPVGTRAIHRSGLRARARLVGVRVSLRAVMPRATALPPSTAGSRSDPRARARARASLPLPCGCLCVCAARDGDARRRSAVRRGVASVTPARRSLIVAAASDLLREVRLGAFGAVRQELEALEGKGVCSLRLSVVSPCTARLCCLPGVNVTPDAWAVFYFQSAPSELVMQKTRGR